MSLPTAIFFSIIIFAASPRPNVFSLKLRFFKLDLNLAVEIELCGETSFIEVLKVQEKKALSNLEKA